MRVAILMGLLVFAAGCSAVAPVQSASNASSCVQGEFCSDSARIDPEIQAAYDAMAKAASSRPAYIEPFEQAIHADFTRTGDGGSISPRTAYIESMAGWYAEGNHVASEKEDLLDVRRSGETTLIRRRIAETMADAQGNTIGAFDGVVIDIWVRESGRWWLFYRDVATVTE